MNIALALNHKYVRYAYVMLTSLLRNQTVPHIHIYLLHNDLTAQDLKYFQDLVASHRHEITFLPVDISIFPASLPTTKAWSLETYFRLLLLDILPADVDRLLYLDVDMIIDKPIDELYYTDFEDKLFCVCRDCALKLTEDDLRNKIFKEHFAQNFTYFNAGMMLWNIDALRKKYCFEDYMRTAKQLDYQLEAPDQDLLNYMHWKEIKYVDEFKYDLFSKFAYNKGVTYADVKRETSIVHFAGTKPWEGEVVHYEIEQLWWDYAKLTPFYHELLEEFVFATITNPLIFQTMSNLSNENQQLTTELRKCIEICNKLLIQCNQ